METTGDGTFFEEEDQVRLKCTDETGRIHAASGGVVSVLKETTNERRCFVASEDEDAALEHVAGEDAADDHDAMPFSEQQSEAWLLERTYHAHLLNGRELSVATFTEAMKQLIDFPVPLSSQSCTSHLAERVPLQKSTNFSAPLPAWREISSEEAHTLYHQGNPVLLYGEHKWDHPKGAMGT